MICGSIGKFTATLELEYCLFTVGLFKLTYIIIRDHIISYFIIHRPIIVSYFSRPILLWFFNWGLKCMAYTFCKLYIGLYVVSCVCFNIHLKGQFIELYKYCYEARGNYRDWPFSGKYGNEVSIIGYSPENGLKRPSRKTPPTGICGQHCHPV